MNTEAHTGNQSVGMAEIEAQTDDDQEYVAVPREWVESVESRLEEQAEEIEELQEEVNRADASRGHIIEDIVDVEEQIDELETDSEGANPTPEAGKSGSPDLYQPESPLEQITNLPEHIADEQLTKNQERARFVAKDIQQYADLRKGELVLSTGDIKQVLSAKEERSIHWQTVGRVVEFLDEMGKEATTVKDKRGTIVCFNLEAAKKFGTQQVTSVVTGQRGEV